MNRANRLVRVSAEGEVSTLFEGGPLDFPATTALAPDHTLFVTSFALGAFLAGAEAHPAIVKVTLP